MDETKDAERYDEGLGEVLHRATDRIESPGMAGAALAGARRARRRRGVVAVAAVAASVLVVLGGVRLVGGTLGAEPDPAAPTPTDLPASTDAPTQPVPAPPDEPVVHPTWDPFTVVDAPLRDTVLPELLEPPDDAPAIEDDPVPAAVVAWPAAGRDVMLLGEDGRWRSVPGTADALSGTFGDVVEPALGHGGQKVAMSTDAGILVVEVATGARRTIPWPDPVAPPWDTAPELRWAPLGNAAGLAVLHWNETWLVELDGTAQKAPYSRPYGTGLAFEPVGPVVEKRWEELDLRVWDGAPHVARITSTVPFGYWGERLVFERGLMALTGGGNGLPGDAGPMVVEAATGTVLGYAPIRDRSGAYSDNGRLTALGFLDDRTVLLLVGPMDFRTMELGEEAWHLVAWDFRDSEFERLTSGGTGMHDIAVAAGVLAADW